jgi:N12 class adenine-specific DNA methylase
LVELVKDAAAKLFFLANKSQDQISDEYRRVSDDIEAIRDAIAIELKTQELLEPRGNS